MPYSCVAPSCPIPHVRYDVRLKRPPGCRFTGRCSVVAAPDDVPAAPAPDEPEAPPIDAEQRDDAPAPEELPAVLRFLKQPVPVSTPAAVLIIDGQRIAVSFPCVLGRHGSIAAAAFANDRSVSREHAELRIDGNAVVVRNIAASGNTLTVDGRDLAFGDSAVIQTGTHHVRFGPNRAAALEIG